MGVNSGLQLCSLVRLQDPGVIWDRTDEGRRQGKGRGCPSICAFIRSHWRACRCLFHPDAGLRMQGALRSPERRGMGDITESQRQWSTGAGGPRSKKDEAWGRKLSKCGWLSVRCEGTMFQQQRQPVPRQRGRCALRSFGNRVDWVP